MRYYTHVLPKTSRAVRHFNNVPNLSHVLHLGDIVDGRETKEESESDLTAVLNTLEPLKAPLHHVVGNHCFEAGGRERLLEMLNIKDRVYRAVELGSRWRLIILDSLNLSIENADTPELAAQAREYLEVHKEDDNATDYNGGLGTIQMEWLREQLDIAKEEESTNVIIALHHPVSKETCASHLVVWNDLETRELISEFSGTVRAVFSGHHHYGGYGIEKGIHYVVFESILDSKNEDGSYGTVTLHDDRIVIEGHGDMTSRELNF